MHLSPPEHRERNINHGAERQMDGWRNVASRDEEMRREAER